jgi:amino acid adenylation domain-containing protein/non-ribosomal peptide synthase protein (TIGR01720 family)
VSDTTRTPDAPPAPDRRARLAALLRKRLVGPHVRPASFAQERLWFLNELNPGSAFYNVPFALRLTGALNAAALGQSLTEIVRRHEVLRTTFAADGGRPVQVVAPPRPVPLPVTDLSHLPGPEREAEARRRAAEESLRPFDLASGPLLRTGLLRLDDRDHVLLVTAHHTVIDGWSVGVFVRELGALYPACCEGRPSPVPTLPVQYGDYADWQRQSLQGEALERLLGHWRDRLRGVPPLELPTDRPRPAAQRFRGAGLTFGMPRELAEGVRSLARAERTTAYAVLLAGFHALLGRYSRQTDFGVGTPAAGRTRAETEALIGFFVNTLVLRADLSGRPTFRELIARTRWDALGALNHQELPFERIVADLQPDRDPARNPLFQVMFALQNMPLTRLELPGLTLSRLDTEEATTTFDLSVALRETADGLSGWCEYDTDLFDAATIRRMMGHFERLLTEAVADPGRRVDDLPLLTDRETERVLAGSRGPFAEYPPGRCLHELVEEQAARTPDPVAVECGPVRLTYAELDRRANRLAHHLRRLGVGPEVCVGVCLERGAGAIVALLGVLKAGGAYVPLDPAYPADRLARMLDDARATVALTDRGLPPGVAFAGAVVALDADMDSAPDPVGLSVRPVRADNLAYVIYTSGSTGRPKGVAVSHAAAVAHLATFARDYHFGPPDRVLQFASLAVDFSLEDVFPALVSGATLVLRGPDLWSPAELVDRVRALGVTVLNLPTAYWHELARELADPAAAGVARALAGQLRHVEIGGEAASAEAVRAWRRAGLGAVRLFNSYGPTEATVTATTYDLPDREEDASAARVPIGRPLANRSAYVLDGRGRPAPVGVPGELCLGGAGLARGYLGRPDLTAERFVPDPHGGPGARVYRTGDRAQWRAGGELEFLGRTDGQVKVRGFRVETGDVETALHQHPRVRAAHAAVREDPQGNARLVAYLVPPEDGRPAPTAAELRAHLKERMPDHAIPSAFVVLAKLPTHPNGKVDVRSLPPVDWGGDRDGEYVAPRTPAEEALAGVWAAVLGVERVGVHDNFFELGGDSILSIQVIARARQAGLRLTPRQMFQYQTVAELAAVAVQAVPPTAAGPGPEAGPAPLTPIQHWFFEQGSPEPHHYNQAVVLEVRGVAPDVLAGAVRAVFAHHDALRLRFAHDGSWRQCVAPAGEASPLERLDLSRLPECEQAAALEAAATALQTGLDLAAGPASRVAFFDRGPGRSARLVWVVHHLAVDGVSWRILLEDLQTACRQLADVGAVTLPPQTTPFTHWARRLVESADGPDFRGELAHWLDDDRRAARTLPVDHPAGSDVAAVARTASAELTADETRRLLTEIPAAYCAEINDVLLTALVRAVTRWTGDRTLLVDLEGHGREELFDDVDVSRTVGWFTSVFPVLLDISGDDRPAGQVRAVRDKLKRVPRRGIGYGLLRYLCRDEAVRSGLTGLPPAEVCFNYLGQFDRVLAGGAEFGPADESIGPAQSPRMRLGYRLEINAWVAGGRFRAEWTYSGALYDPGTVERLARAFCDALRALSEHARSPAAGGYAPADFPEANLTRGELDRLLAALRPTRGGSP